MSAISLAHTQQRNKFSPPHDREVMIFKLELGKSRLGYLGLPFKFKIPGGGSDTKVILELIAKVRKGSMTFCPGNNGSYLTFIFIIYTVMINEL